MTLLEIKRKNDLTLTYNEFSNPFGQLNEYQ